MGHGSVVNRFSWQTLLTADSLSITPLEWQVPCLGNTLKKLYQQQKAGAVLLWGWFFFLLSLFYLPTERLLLLFYCLFSSCTNPGCEISTPNSHIANNFICSYLGRSGWWIACHHSRWKCSHYRQSHWGLGTQTVTSWIDMPFGISSLKWNVNLL